MTGWHRGQHLQPALHKFTDLIDSFTLLLCMQISKLSANKQIIWGWKKPEHQPFSSVYPMLTALTNKPNWLCARGNKAAALLYDAVQMISAYFFPHVEGCSTYHDTFNNALHSYVIVIARNLIQKHFFGRNLSLQKLAFVLRYLCNPGEPPHNGMLLLSTCSNHRRQ